MRTHACRETLARAESLKLKKQMPHPRLFDNAVEEARAYVRILSGATGAAGAAAAAQVAATNAANVNNMPRCRKCEACVNLLSSGRRRCLLVRAFAAAAAGHTGAQLAILGTGAVGAKVNVWWPLDEDWYPGVVTGCVPHTPCISVAPTGVSLLVRRSGHKASAAYCIVLGQIML